MKMKKRYRGQRLFLHEADGLKEREIKDDGAEAKPATDEGEEEEREADREPDEDHPDHEQQHRHAEDLVAAHTWIVSARVSASPVLAA